MGCCAERFVCAQNGTIYLCGRSDGDPSRYFSGSVSHVGMWNTVLTPAQILNLYKTVVVSTASTFSSIPGSPAGAPAGAPLSGAAAPAIQAVQTFAAPQASVTQQLPATGPVSPLYWHLWATMSRLMALHIIHKMHLIM